MSMPIHGLVISNARPFIIPVNQLTIFLRCNSVLKRRELEMALQEQVPIIDMEGIDGLRRSEIIEAVRNASEIWGFFQVMNHGIPVKVMEGVMNGVAEFHRREDDHVKLGLTSCDIMKKVQFQRNVKHVSTHEKLVWKDTLKLDMAPDPPLPNEIPSSCRFCSSDVTMIFFFFFFILRRYLSNFSNQEIPLLLKETNLVSINVSIMILTPIKCKNFLILQHWEVWCLSK